MDAPGNSMSSRDIAFHLHGYTNCRRHEQTGPLVVARGEGIEVVDEDGKRYIEGMAGLWCASLGFGEERLIAAATEQMRRLPYYHGFAHKSHPAVIDLAEALIDIAPVPMSKVFFANSGSEAADTAIKVIRYLNNALGRPEKKKIFARHKAYHGVTLASASLTGLPANHRDFDLPMDGIRHTACPHYWRHAEPGESEEAFASRLAEQLDREIQAEGPETVAAFFAEPVMGAGGVIVPPASYFEKIQKVLRRHDVLLVADEVICGFGRTGAMWGSETYGLKPDMMVCAKGLSSGYLPISALMISDAVYQPLADNSAAIGTFGHGFTYGGHPVAAAVALEALKIYRERDIISHVRAMAPRLQEGLRRLSDHPLVGEVRGVGLVAAVELARDPARKEAFDPALGIGAWCAGRAQEHGVILRALPGDVVAFSPPLVIDEAGIAAMIERFARALDDTAAMVRERGLAGRQ